MDTARFEELKAKAESPGGMTEEEANELGRLYAEEMGEPYGNAESRPHPDEIEPDKSVGEEAGRQEEAGTIQEEADAAPELRPAQHATLGVGGTAPIADPEGTRNEALDDESTPREG